jgi:pimeloyl-ACP methyl ester carboxylesterase
VDDASRWRARSVADRTRGFAAAIDLPNDGTIRADGCLWARGNTALDPRTRHRQLATWNHGQSLDRADSTPKVPVRLYSGQLDVDVYPDESIHQAARWRDRHVDVEHIDLGPVAKQSSRVLR